MKNALIAGASGLTGTELLKLLLASPEYLNVYSLVRKPIGITHSKLKEIIFDFDHPETSLNSLTGIHDVFCCLGSTIKKAGSKEVFKKIDYQYPLDLACWSEKNGVRYFACISAMGADSKSSVFYSKVKGEMEGAIGKLNIPSVYFFRPSLLLGDRKEKRGGEKLAIYFMKFIAPVMRGPLLNYKGIHVRKVAQAMISSASNPETGVTVVLSGKMQGC